MLLKCAAYNSGILLFLMAVKTGVMSAKASLSIRG